MSKRDTRQQQQPRGERGRRAKDHSPRPRTRPPTPKLCVYCNQRPHATRDHVFAQGLFSPQPIQTITVPVCRECNQGSGDGIARPMNHDEEYFRTVLCMRDGVERHPVAMRVLNDKVFKAFDNSPGLMKSIVSQTELVVAQNASGVLIPNVPQFKVDWPRVQRVLRKIVKGLFFQYMQRPVPATAIIKTFPYLDQHDFDMTRYWIEHSPQRVGPINLGDTAVIYAGSRTSADCDDTIWLVNFYQSIGVSMFTMSPTTARVWKWAADPVPVDASKIVVARSVPV